MFKQLNDVNITDGFGDIRTKRLAEVLGYAVIGNFNNLYIK